MFVLWVTSRSKASSLLVLFVVADLAGVLGSRYVAQKSVLAKMALADAKAWMKQGQRGRPGPVLRPARRGSEQRRTRSYG
jgi:hypothetical protein